MSNNAYKTYSWTYNEKLWNLQHAVRVDLESDLGTSVENIYDEFMTIHASIQDDLDYYDKLSNYITHQDEFVIEIVKDKMKEAYSRIVDIQKDLQNILRCNSDVFEDLLQAVTLISTVSDKKKEWDKFACTLDHIDKINNHYYTYIVPLSEKIEVQEFLDMDDESIQKTNKCIADKVKSEKEKIAELHNTKDMFGLSTHLL